MNLDFLTVGAITIMVYLAATIIKSMSTSEKLDRMIPGICGTIGLALMFITTFLFDLAVPYDFNKELKEKNVGWFCCDRC